MAMVSVLRADSFSLFFILCRLLDCTIREQFFLLPLLIPFFPFLSVCLQYVQTFAVQRLRLQGSVGRSGS